MTQVHTFAVLESVSSTSPEGVLLDIAAVAILLGADRAAIVVD